MKFTQNAVIVSVYRLVGRLCQTPRRFTEWSCRAPSDIDGQAGGRAKRELGSQTLYNRIAPALFGFLICTAVLAQNADNIADREVQRRQSAIPNGEAALARGKTAMRAKNYSVAYQEFKTAVGNLPDSVVSGKAHDEAAEG